MIQVITDGNSLYSFDGFDFYHDIVFSEQKMLGVLKSIFSLLLDQSVIFDLSCVVHTLFPIRI